MNTIIRWNFPVPTTCIASGVHLIHDGCDALLSFDYYDENKGDAVFNSSILFKGTQAHRHTSEKFLTSVGDAYDTLVEIVDSAWTKEFHSINKEISNYWKIKHYAIFIDSYGLYEFIAKGHELLKENAGELIPLILNCD